MIGDGRAVTPEPDARGYRRLEEAVAGLRAVADPGSAEAAARLLARAAAATRRSGHVVARAPGGPVRVARHVVVAYLREAVDTVPGVAAAGVTLRQAGREDLTGVTLDVVARFGTDLAAAGDGVHAVAVAALTRLGLSPVVHVRFVEVTRGDPATSAD